MDLRARVEALNETRLRVVNEYQGELDATAGRERSGEESEKIARMDAHIDEIDAEIRELVRRETREREAAQLRSASAEIFGDRGVVERDKAEGESLARWMLAPRGEYRGPNTFEVDINRVIRERQLLRQGASNEEIRALAWDATSGSLIVPTTMARSLYEYLEASIAGFRIGATTLVTSHGEPMQLPKLTTHSIGSQVAGQGSAIAQGDPVFGRVNLDVYKYGQLAKVASEMTDSVFDVGQFLGRDIGYALGRVIDADLIVGTGSSEPTGMTLLAGAGTNAPVTTGGSLIAPTVEKYIDTQYAVNDAYRANAKWLLKDSTAGTIRKLRDGAGGTVGAFLWEPSLTNGLKDGTPDGFLGSPVYTDTNCAAAGSNAKLATYGDFSTYIIRTVGNPVIERDDSVYFATDEVAFRGKWRIGGNHRDVSAFSQLVQNV